MRHASSEGKHHRRGSSTAKFQNVRRQDFVLPAIEHRKSCKLDLRGPVRLRLAIPIRKHPDDKSLREPVLKNAPHGFQSEGSAQPIEFPTDEDIDEPIQAAPEHLP